MSIKAAVRPRRRAGLSLTILFRSLPRLLLALAAAPAIGLHAQVGALVGTKVFHGADGSARAEVNIAVMGASTQAMLNDHGFHQSRVEATTIITAGERIVDFHKTEIAGPELLDTAVGDFLHVERFRLDAGEYALEVTLRDLNAPEVPPTTYEGPMVVAALGDGLRFSDVLLAERIDPAADPDAGAASIVPAVSSYYPAEKNDLGFYAELYNADKVFGPDSLFLLSYQIEGFEDRRVFGGFRKQSRARALPVIPILAQFDITTLPSGNFLLAFEARDRKGSVIARQEQFFQRNKPMSYDMATLAAGDLSGTFVHAYTDADTLAEDIRSLRPIASDLERKIIDDRWKDRDMDLMRRFFYSFWFNRNGYAPEQAWRRYQQEVVKVNQLYGCRIKRGYDTDRGYVHLKYGAPNTIMDQPHDRDGYPFQIWHYYRAGKYANKRFVFYLPDRVTGCYELLHSEVPGEIKNPNWNQMLHAANVPMNNVQDNSVPIGHGEQVQEWYNSPR